MGPIGVRLKEMIVERITLLAIYRSLKQLETNEGRIYDIVLNRKTNTSTKSPEAFKSLEDLKRFVQANYPWQNEVQQAEVCTWLPYAPVKFWVEKNNGTLVAFKAELEVKKTTSLFAISKKRMRELDTYLKTVNKNNNGLIIDSYVAPTTPTYVECVYIDDLVKNDPYYWMFEEYKKYIKP